MESGESLGPPVSAWGLRMALHAEAKGDAATVVALLGAPWAGDGRAALPVASTRDRRAGAVETCAPRTSTGDRVAPAGTVSGELSVSEGHDPG